MDRNGAPELHPDVPLGIISESLWEIPQGSLQSFISGMSPGKRQGFVSTANEDFF